MAVKTLTITKEAYEALKALKEPDESFSKTITRIAGKKSIREFAGVLSYKSAKRLENSINEIRKRHTESYRGTLERTVKTLNRR